MNLFSIRKYSLTNQYIISISLIVLISVISYFSVGFIGYRVVAMILLLFVSFLAMLFDIFPVLVTAFLSAFIWNFFFIPPTFTFHIGTTEDSLMFLMYFVIALINAVLTFKIRLFEKKARDKEEKENTIKLYNTLLNSLSHELRTPISTIIGAIDTINGNETKLPESIISELHNEIKIAGFRLNRQVENLLSMSRLEAGILKPKIDWCDMNELIFSVINENKDDSKDHRVVFEPQEHLPLYKIDRGFVEQIIHNIVHNALQYTPKNALIKLEVAHVNGKCQLVISDNGTGFPKNEIDLVFDKFYRLSHSATGGTGLGLSIAKGFTEALGGTIYLENLPTGGAKFTVVIPAESSFISNVGHE